MRLYLDTSAILASIKEREEPEHNDAQALVKSAPSINELVTSSLSITELTVALAKRTREPEARIGDIITLLTETYDLQIFNHDDFLDATRLVAFEQRNLCRRYDIPSADVHHVSAAYQLEASHLVTTDKKHLLREEARKGLARYVSILSPKETVVDLRLS